MTPVAVIRPQPGCDATVKAARAMGLDARAFPLFAIRPLAWDPPAPEEVDALLLGSAMALRHGGAGLARFSGKPAYVVGEATAKAAGEAGFPVVAVGSGGLQQVVDRLSPSHRRLFRACGADRVALVLPEGTSMTERVVYANGPQPMGEELAGLLRKGGLVLLHSASAATHLRRECERLGIPLSAVTLAALGPRIAEAAGTGWASIAVAPFATDSQVLALAAGLCQTPPERQAESGSDAGR